MVVSAIGRNWGGFFSTGTPERTPASQVLWCRLGTIVNFELQTVQLLMQLPTRPTTNCIHLPSNNLVERLIGPPEFRGTDAVARLVSWPSLSPMAGAAAALLIINLPGIQHCAYRIILRAGATATGPGAECAKNQSQSACTASDKILVEKKSFKRRQRCNSLQGQCSNDMGTKNLSSPIAMLPPELMQVTFAVGDPLEHHTILRPFSGVTKPPANSSRHFVVVYRCTLG